MSSTRSPNSFNAFVIDAFCASMDLHAVNERDAPAIRAAAIRKGRQSYRTLVQRRKALRVSSNDASTIESILKNTETRLELLCAVSTFRRNQWRWRRKRTWWKRNHQINDAETSLTACQFRN